MDVNLVRHRCVDNVLLALQLLALRHRLELGLIGDYFFIACRHYRAEHIVNLNSVGFKRRLVALNILLDV